MGLGLVVIGIAVLAAIIFALSGALWLLTSHDRTLVVTDTQLDVGKDESYYLVYGEGNQVVEVKRLWFQWGSNEDITFNKAKQNIGKAVTFSCWGWQFDQWYWYSNCPDIKSVKNVTS